MVPDGGTNLAVKDVANALAFLRKFGPSFGGNAAKMTIAGQSSGASMVRALLAVPSVSSLFQSGIIQSDPMVPIVSLNAHVTHVLLLCRTLAFFRRLPNKPCKHTSILKSVVLQPIPIA
jgi:carboxylesterase type B